MHIVKDIIRKNINPLSIELSLPEAVDRILASGLSGLPVVNSHNKLVGFLSEHDCIPHLITGTYHCDTRTLVKDLMHGEPLSVSPEDSIIDIAQMMAGNKPKVYPVIDEYKLVGIICRQDILKALSKEIQNCVSFA